MSLVGLQSHVLANERPPRLAIGRPCKCEFLVRLNSIRLAPIREPFKSNLTGVLTATSGLVRPARAKPPTPHEKLSVLRWLADADHGRGAHENP
jgi:hypothetical protein